MQCREIVNELDAYRTGELDSDASANVGHHLESCAGCRAELELLRYENGIYRDYASAMDSRGDIREWTPDPVGRQRPVNPWWRWAAAAAVLVVAVLSWRFLATRQNAEMAGNVAGGQTTGIPAPVDQALIGYEQAVLLLQASYEGKKPNLDPAIVRDLDRSLKVAGAAVEECRLALKKHPNNPQAVEFLLLGYEKQVGILKQITEAL